MKSGPAKFPRFCIFKEIIYYLILWIVQNNQRKIIDTEIQKSQPNHSIPQEKSGRCMPKKDTV